MPQPSQDAAVPRPDELTFQIESLSRRDVQLWVLGLLVLLVVATGVVALLLPNMVWHTQLMRLESRYLPQLFFGFIAMVVLFNVYLMQQRHELNSTRKGLIQQLLVNQKLQTMALLDPLTQTFNRAYLDQILPREVSRAQRSGKPFSLLLVGVPGFAAINQRLGVAGGDRLLQEVSQVLERTFRGSDTILRYSGESFLMLLPDTAADQVEPAQQRLVRSLGERNAGAPEDTRVEFAFASATWEEGRDAWELLRIAERRLKAERERMAGVSKRRSEQCPACMVISADERVRAQLASVLEAMEVAVEHCVSPEEAAVRLAQQRFEAIILGMDFVEGPGLIRKLRGNASARTAIFIALASSRVVAQECFRLSANFVLEKPLHYETAGRNLRAAYTLMVGERRRYFRHPVDLPVTLTLGDGRTLRAHATNLSEAGMAVQTSEPLQGHARLHVQFSIPGLPHALECQAEVSWANDTGRAGLKLLYTKAAVKRQVENWLAERWKEQCEAEPVHAAESAPARPPYLVAGEVRGAAQEPTVV